MTVLNTADRIYKGTSLASNVNLGTAMVWPVISPSFVVFDSATATGVLITGGGLNVKNTTSGLTQSGARVADAYGKTAGKFYYELTMTSWATGGSIGLGGVGTIGSSFTNMQNNATTGVTIHSSGQVWTLGSVPVTFGTRSNGNIIGIAVDLDNRKIWFRIAPSGNWNNNASYDPVTNVGGVTIPSGTMVPFVSFGGVSTGPGNIVKTNFGHYGFTGAVPSGFTSGWTV